MRYHCSQYSVSSLGRVKSKDGHLRLPVLSQFGYHVLHLRLEGKDTTVGIHRMVAEAFLPNPEQLPIVDHINRNRIDNQIDNLRWVSLDESSQNRNIKPYSGGGVRRVDQFTSTGEFLRTWESLAGAARETKINKNSISRCCRGTGQLAGNYTWAFHDESLPNEVWKPSEYPGIGQGVDVSTLGRVRWRDRITSGTKSGRYRTYQGIYVHRLIADAFLTRTNECDVVDHLDCDPANNAVYNLEWVTQAENVRRAHAKGLTKHKNGKGIAVEAIGAGQVRQFPSVTAAARYHGCSHSLISMACRGQCKTAVGYTWRYLPDRGLVSLSEEIPEPPPSNPAPFIADNDPLWIELGLAEVTPHIANDDPLWDELGL